MPHKRNPQLSDDCITIGAQLRALVPLTLEGMLHDHEVDGAHSAMLDDALERACVLAGDLLVRLEVIVSGLDVDPARSPAPSSASSQVANAMTRLPGARLIRAGPRRPRSARSGSPRYGTGRTTGRSPPPYTRPLRRPGPPGHDPAAWHAPSRTAARGVPVRSARPRCRA
jgi:hypothetical protein